MDRVIQMVVRMFLNRGLRMLFRKQRRGRGSSPQESAADRAQRETAERMRETQRLSRRIGH